MAIRWEDNTPHPNAYPHPRWGNITVDLCALFPARLGVVTLPAHTAFANAGNFFCGSVLPARTV